MITLAIDGSTKSTGQSIYEGQELKQYGCITASSQNLYKRIDKMTTEINKIIEEWKVEQIVMEDVIPDDVRGNQTVFKALMYLQGFLMKLFDKHNLPVTLFVASEQRKKCSIRTGRGVHRESLKPQDIKFVKDQFGLSVNDDIADAICIGFAAVGGTIKEPQVIIEGDFEFA